MVQGGLAWRHAWGCNLWCFGAVAAGACGRAAVVWRHSPDHALYYTRCLPGGVSDHGDPPLHSRQADG